MTEDFLMSPLPVIAITLGEPAGIGPEIALKAAWKLRHDVYPVLIGDSLLLEKLAPDIDPEIKLHHATREDIPHIRSLCHPGTLVIIDRPLAQPVKPGYPDPASATAILSWLDIAIEGTIKKHFDAIATAPVQKSTINAAGIAFTGHTEYLAEKLQADQVVMLLAGHIDSPTGLKSGSLRVALATTHLPLKDIPDAITQASLMRTLRILHQELQEKFRILQPRILVSGLNPHAGENGYLGMEEIEIITPVIQSLQQQGMKIEGPFPADTLFLPHYLDQADCFFVMYHDQGLPVLKYATFGHGVNVTLGLPVIRTSVDHGTALDIAVQGTGRADDGSMIEAIRLAADMVSR
ncbi:4-hydroxythreonine-4-phosphate dehydrogenase PdxA [Oxalobacter vibrioformis]|uniref:4-hydroxythreonine-4-phosphate dehydrogenase n=1 Tax=Oxalobacter vibrioformis TaxID=933080 RepID=A0A9E9P5E7_9BURK|nr:4-hydroxythreonine-4-phosphate dehydrogenase PdxA [Oxalobacter vibrioformis]WAW11026.1 4-hydroxythreonine-4-phosphate dehydrogenase PdxA [Oxalobacter vibrioformis]